MLLSPVGKELENLELCQKASRFPRIWMRPRQPLPDFTGMHFPQSSAPTYASEKPACPLTLARFGVTLYTSHPDTRIP